MRVWYSLYDCLLHAQVLETAFKKVKSSNPVLRGFVNYFKVANCKTELKKLMSWLRRRLRAIQMKLWKKPQKLHRRLRQLGYK
ncbi:hypothetical protein SCARR_01841 [Pontiella sulfatireligans]|uniref:Group II intron maturase-specific domain-containing protein n=2 Tax=Pontiella sulfatireligans TaxID=2750658 RepID=A0A6C2UHT7_9BACT|nr:hypothetical protein SCARR_01841 [Pontiella sulfatireligans]